MKKLNDLMKELGFNDSAPKSTGKAFINNLLRASQLAQVSETGRLSEWETKKTCQQGRMAQKPKGLKGEQLSFHFEELADQLKNRPKQKKSS